MNTGFHSPDTSSFVFDLAMNIVKVKKTHNQASFHNFGVTQKRLKKTSNTRRTRKTKLKNLNKKCLGNV